MYSNKLINLIIVTLCYLFLASHVANGASSNQLNSINGVTEVVLSQFQPFSLVVSETGFPPRDVQARALSYTTVVVDWERPEQPLGQISGYRVYFTSNPSLPTSLWEYLDVDDSQLTTISELQRETIYTIRVSAITTSRGEGPLSLPVQVKTKQGVPNQPSGLQAVAQGPHSIKLAWKKAPNIGENIVGYDIYWNDTFENTEGKQAIPDSDTYIIENLYPDTLYYIWIAARSNVGEGAATPPIAVRTEIFGAPPQEVHGQVVDSRTLKISWKPPLPTPEIPIGNITYYKVIVTRVNQDSIDISENNIDSDNSNNIHNNHDEAINGSRNETSYEPFNNKLNASFTNPKKVNSRPNVTNSNFEFTSLGPDNSYVIENLEEWTSYSIKVKAGTSMGEGPASRPIILRTEEAVPGEPRDVKAVAINSTAIRVEWNSPSNIDQHGVRRGYQIYVHEMSSGNREEFLNDPIKFDVLDPNAKEFNVTSLQPDTSYNIQVAAITRKGDGTRSKAYKVTTLGGVPTKPDILIRLMSDEPQMTIEVQWTRPKHTYGALLGYRLKYGRAIDTNLDEIEINPQEQSKIIKDLDRGIKYVFRLAGKSSMGWGQEAVAYIETPEGSPGAPPQNISYRLQTPTTVVITWDPPLPEYRNGRITNYGIHFQKPVDTSPEERFTNETRMVFSSLSENAEYTCKIRAFTSKGAGPWSNRIQIHTPGDVPPAPTNVQAMATTEKSVEVWWDQMPFFADILGYTVLYTQTTAVEDIDFWYNKTVVLTWSVELTGLKANAMYAIRVAAYTNAGLGRLSELITVRTTPVDVPISLRAYYVTTHTMSLSWRQPTKLNPIGYKITYEAHKEFYDSLSMLKTLPISPSDIRVNSSTTQITIENLMPFTSYQVNVTALPADGTYRPPARKTVTTAMAAPKPMVKPDSIGVQNNEINVILPQASEEYGPISHYFLVVVPSQFATKDPDLYSIEELTSTPMENLGPYIAAKFPRRSVPSQFPLGDGKKYNGYRNRRLKPNIYYKIFVRAIVDAPHKNLFTSSPFSLALSTNAPLESSYRPPIKTSISAGPNIAQMSPSMDGQKVLGIVAIVMITMILIIIVVVLVYINRRRQLLKASNVDTTLKLLMNTVDPRDNISHPSDPVEMRRITYQTAGMMNHPPIPVTELGNHTERLKADDNLLFSQEYESIEPGQQFTWENSNMEINKPKNRYANVIAYDHSRVVLQTLDGIPGSDYINANYCDGYRKQNAYIATQGPLPDTIGDFWRMIWEQRSYSIVMMTKLEERTRVKCDQYWPTRGTENYGVMQVTLINVEELAYYCVRTFTLQRYGYMESREVKQFQFTAWPDHGVPDHPTPFLMFLRRIKIINPLDAGPMIVHCSAGVGRSGCFIVIDSMLERLKYENSVDIYGHVTVLRAQRNYMVQTEDQYIFIYDAVLEAVIAGHTEVSIRNIYNHVQMLVQVVPGDSITGMELEFKKIASMKTPTSKFISANLPCNKFKNRLMNILPYENNRVFLQPLRAVEGSDYINASFIDGYRYRSAYIATQGPIPETTEDFWRMLWEHNSNIIVILTKVKEMGRDKCHHYWPSERSQRYLYFVVDPITEYNMPQYILREFKVTDARDGQSRTIRQFHFVEWPEQGVPKSGDGFIDFITQVHKTKEQFGQEGPITVHCSAGVGRTGVFISLSIVLDRIQNEGVIDLFQTVRTLRTQRPGMVQTEDQYQFCYRAALEYISTFDYST